MLLDKGGRVKLSKGPNSRRYGLTRERVFNRIRLRCAFQVRKGQSTIDVSPL
jgi:hypothetical protein